MSLRYLTAGETHGPQLTAIIEGLPSNLTLDFEELNFQLHRRQKGYGRGRRMQIEKDTAQIAAWCTPRLYYRSSCSADSREQGLDTLEEHYEH